MTGLAKFAFLEWHNLEVFALSHCDRDGLQASIPEAWRTYKPQKALSVANSLSLFFSYVTRLYFQGTEEHRLMVGRIADVKDSIYLYVHSCVRRV